MSSKGGGSGGDPGDGVNHGLQQQIIELRAMVAQLAQNSAIENVVQQGFARLSTQLEPLRDMSPARQYPKPPVMEAFRQIQRAIAQPAWRGSKFEADLPPIVDPCGRSSQS